MNAAIYLHQHAFLAHALATDPMQWGSTSTGASHAGAYQDTPDYISVDEAAEVLGVSERHV